MRLDKCCAVAVAIGIEIELYHLPGADSEP